ncbi:MAG: hypothetical protein C4523_06385 [Myxococcales bacterium]|nr:MAG: hypothetical protein C4523_06385 [Myxococcales bacterium]
MESKVWIKYFIIIFAILSSLEFSAYSQENTKSPFIQLGGTDEKEIVNDSGPINGEIEIVSPENADEITLDFVEESAIFRNQFIATNQQRFDEFYNYVDSFNAVVFEVQILDQWVDVNEDKNVFGDVVSPEPWKVFALTVSGEITSYNIFPAQFTVRFFGAEYPREVRERLPEKLLGISRTHVPKFSEFCKSYFVAVPQSSMDALFNDEPIELINERQVLSAEEGFLREQSRWFRLTEADSEKVRDQWYSDLLSLSEKLRTFQGAF